MKVEIRGPDNLQQLKWNEDGSVEPSGSNTFYCNCKTLKEALETYCNEFNSSYRTYDGKVEGLPLENGEFKYYYYNSSNPKFGEILVDIHVKRLNGDEVCAKHDLALTLKDGDVINLGPLAC